MVDMAPMWNCLNLTNMTNVIKICNPNMTNCDCNVTSNDLVILKLRKNI